MTTTTTTTITTLATTTTTRICGKITGHGAQSHTGTNAAAATALGTDQMQTGVAAAAHFVA